MSGRGDQLDLMPKPRRARPKRTEDEMLELLRKRHSGGSGNGPTHAFIPAVRNAAAFDASRTIDGYGMSLWPSRGLLIDAFEIKCSRSDWQRELKEPAKAEAFCELADRFWIVAAHDDIVADGELPDGWGLLVAQGKRLLQRVEAALLHPEDLTVEDGEPFRRTTRLRPLPPGFNRSFLAALLRAASYVQSAGDPELQAARDEEREHLQRLHEGQMARAEQEAAQLQAVIRDFNLATGLNIASGWHRGNGVDARRIGELVKAAMSGELQANALENRISGARLTLRSALDALERTAAEYGIDLDESKPTF
jgi:hypothetical protein